LGEFRRFLAQLLAVGGVFGLAGLAAAQFMGPRLLTFFYSAEYAAYSRVFLLLMLATAIHCVASMLNCGIMSARRFWIQAPMFGLVTICSALACYRWVPAGGLIGGAMAMVAAAGLRLALAAGVVGYLLLAPSDGAMGRESAPSSLEDWKPGL
jgi:O-antigen/teichoic acid export membrane protein